MGRFLLCEQIADRQGQLAQDAAHVLLGHRLQGRAGLGRGLDGGRTVGTGPQHLDVIPGLHAAQAVLHAVHAAEQAPAAVLQLLVGDGPVAQVGQLLEDGLFGAGRVSVLHTAVHGHAAGKTLEGGRAVVAQVVPLPHIEEQAAGHAAAVQGHGKAHSGQLLGEDKRYGFVAETTLKGRKIILLKPTTFMNLSGNAVRYWLNQEKIDQSRLLVISDELALPLGAFRLKANGSNGGHNGLGHIQQLIGQNYARLRMGIGNDYPRGGQIDWVLGKYSEEDMKELQPAIDLGVEIIKSFVLAGINNTMNQYNKLGKK